MANPSHDPFEWLGSVRFSPQSLRDWSVRSRVALAAPGLPLIASAADRYYAGVRHYRSLWLFFLRYAPPSRER